MCSSDLAGIGGSLLVRRTLRPLDGVARLAGDVARTPLDRGSVTLAERVPERYAVPGTEVGEVGRALNHLLDNVEGAIEDELAKLNKMMGDRTSAYWKGPEAAKLQAPWLHQRD